MAELLYYRLAKMTLSQFATFANEVKQDEPIAQNNEIRFLFDREALNMTCQMEVVLSQGEQPLLKAVLETAFVFMPQSIEILTKEGKTTFSATILGHLASLTYSSMRGALHIKAQETALRDYVLPLQNLFEVIKKPYVVEVENTE